MKIRKVRPDSKIPIRASDGAVGYDVYASVVLSKETKEPICELPFILEPSQSVLIGIGVQMAVPWPWECQVRPRSGLANKHNIELSNSPGTIDPDFRGEAGVLLRNRGKVPFTVEKEMRVAQLIFAETKIPVLDVVEELPPTRRGSGGFGSTGLFEIGIGTGQFDSAIAREDRYYMGIAIAASDFSTCVRGCPTNRTGKYKRDKSGAIIGRTRKFGCVVVKDGNIVGHGYNAQRQNTPPCAEVGCLRDQEKILSGTKIERCRAMHAEWWVLTNMLKSGSSSLHGATMYLNAEPCAICATLIAGSGIQAVVLLEGVYPNNGIQMLRDAGINIRYVKIAK